MECGRCYACEFIFTCARLRFAKGGRYGLSLRGSLRLAQDRSLVQRSSVSAARARLHLDRYRHLRHGRGKPLPLLVARRASRLPSPAGFVWEESAASAAAVRESLRLGLAHRLQQWALSDLGGAQLHSEHQSPLGCRHRASRARGQVRGVAVQYFEERQLVYVHDTVHTTNVSIDTRIHCIHA